MTITVRREPALGGSPSLSSEPWSNYKDPTAVAILPSRANASPLLIGPLAVRPKRPYAQRALVVGLAVALIVLLVATVDGRWLAADSLLGLVFYWLHDTLFLPLKGWLWTAIFPVGAIALAAALVTFVAVMLGAYLTGADATRWGQAALIRYGCRTPWGTNLLLLVVRTNGRAWSRSEFLRRVAWDDLESRLDVLRGHLRRQENVPATQIAHIFEGIIRSAAISALGPVNHMAAFLQVSALFLALRAGEPGTQQAIRLRETLRHSLQATAPALEPRLAAQINLALPGDNNLDTAKRISAEVRLIAERTNREHHLIQLLAQESARPIDPSTALEDFEARTLLLLAAIAVSLNRGSRHSALQIALGGVEAIEQMLATDDRSPGAGVYASLAIGLTDARLHAAVLARLLVASAASTNDSWSGLVEDSGTTDAYGQATAAASPA